MNRNLLPWMIHHVCCCCCLFLKGGTSVTFTVRAYKETVPDSYAEESITITTLYSDLEAVIAQGQFITVGRDSGDLELDGSLSYDPDNEAIDATYEWLCEQVMYLTVFDILFSLYSLHHHEDYFSNWLLLIDSLAPVKVKQ